MTEIIDVKFGAQRDFGGLGALIREQLTLYGGHLSGQLRELIANEVIDALRSAYSKPAQTYSVSLVWPEDPAQRAQAQALAQASIEQIMEAQFNQDALRFTEAVLTAISNLLRKTRPQSP